MAKRGTIKHTIELISYDELIPCAQVKTVVTWRIPSNLLDLFLTSLALASVLIDLISDIQTSVSVYIDGWLNDLAYMWLAVVRPPYVQEKV